MDRQGHRLDTEARGIPAVSGTRTLVTAPWTSSGAKRRRENRAKQAIMDRAGLTSDIVYIAKPVVPKANPKPRMKTNAVKVYVDPTRIIKSLAPSNGGNPDA